MLKNYIKIAFRNIYLNKVFSLITILGLTVGLVVCILILLWVQDELNYDQFNVNKDHIYRVNITYMRNGVQLNHWRTPPPLALTIKEEFPEIIDATKFYNEEDVIISRQTKTFRVKAGFTDGNILNIFSLPLAARISDNPLQEPNTIILNKQLAERLYGDDDPLGTTVRMNDEFELTVGGVLADIPDNTHLQFDFLVPFEWLVKVTGYGDGEDWSDFGYNTFLLLQPSCDIEAIGSKITSYVNGLFAGIYESFYLQSLNDIHLYALNGGGPIVNIFIFSTIALLIMLIACTNFMNLTTARSARRAKEIGLRKIAGASQNQLKLQFLTEAVIFSLLALVLAFFFVESILPLFNEFTGKEISLYSVPFKYVLFIIGITFLTGLISGFYPALLLSSYKPVKTLQATGCRRSSLLRSIFVVSQFTMSIILIICTIVISRQLQYIRSRDLGFDKDNILYIPINDDLMRYYDAFKQELTGHPDIISVTGTSSYIGMHHKWSAIIRSWEGNNGEREVDLPLISCDENFAETFGLEMVAGRFYDPAYPDDMEYGIVLNETAVNYMDLQDPVGKKFGDYDSGGHHICGIIRDFHFNSLHQRIEPLALVNILDWHSYFAMKIKPGNIAMILDFIKTTQKKYAPAYPFEYHFLDDEFMELYQNEYKLRVLFNWFAVLAIMISCLGLYGLASFLIQQRRKEIGIRKVMGANATGIISNLILSFSWLVIISIFIAWPAAWYASRFFLDFFAYRIDLNIQPFIIAGIITLVMTCLTVGYQTVKAAFTNPAETLKYE